MRINHRDPEDTEHTEKKRERTTENRCLLLNHEECEGYEGNGTADARR